MQVNPRNAHASKLSEPVQVSQEFLVAESSCVMFDFGIEFVLCTPVSLVLLLFANFPLVALWFRGGGFHVVLCLARLL